MSEEDSVEDESFDIDEIQSSSNDSIFLYDGTKVSDPSALRIKKYDFTNPIVLSDADLTQLKSNANSCLLLGRPFVHVLRTGSIWN